MKFRLLFVIMFVIIFINVCNNHSLQAQDNKNVLSYYASDNSIDGQPRIDMINLLRFFPVFVFREDITDVNVSVFYSGKIITQKTDRMSGGHYWQTILPEFKLGDAIQRIEVEMIFKLREQYIRSLINYDSAISQAKNNIKDVRGQIAASNRYIIKQASNLDLGFTGSTLLKIYNDFLKLDLPKYGITKQDSIEFIANIIGDINKYKNKSNQVIDSLSLVFFNLISDQAKVSKLKYYLHKKNTNTENFLDQNREIGTLNLEKEKIIDDIYKNINTSFTDSTFSGPAVRKSDLIISGDYKTAKLLYRYYKNNLRYRKALDPAENLGIFRVRYIPFPITKKPGGSKVEMYVPAQKNSNAVFEIGLSFGDNIVSGDNTFNPGLSLSRLGVAIVISEKLFGESAEILGLALTYDFNSYASIGLGRNLAQGESYPYYSFGINKKAFEELIKGLAGIFK